jgi:glycosyltransferase involved in cell wall biosynthesis
VPLLSIVTTCKGRLHHLRRTLPSFLQQPDCEVIVVDYDCPDDTAGVCAREFPTAQIVKVHNAPRFNLSRARNLGAAESHGEWIAFFDADIVMAPDFFRRLGPTLKAHGTFHRFFPNDFRTYSACGSCVVRREDYLAVDRYDEVFAGYSGEDQDLYFRLELSGVRGLQMDFDMLAEVIQHRDEDRVRFGVFDTVVRHQQVNDVYCMVKHSALRHLGVNGLPEPERRKLYRLIGEVVNDAARTPEMPIHFTMELPRDPIGMGTPGWRAKRHLVFNLTPAPDDLTIRAERLAADQAADQVDAGRPE